MDVEARSQKVLNILTKGVFTIPDFQREYDWDNEEVEEFLADINDIKAEESYFIGHMVFEGEYNGDAFNVIDGQQRITTITILLSVIRDLFYLTGEKDLADAINDKFIFGKDLSNNPYVILENKMPYPVLQAYVQSIPEKKNTTIKAIKSGERRIIKIYDYLYKALKNKTTEELERLRDSILNLELIFVAVSDQVDAFTIFETLNATGKDLTPMDLIKNQVFRLYPREPHINEPNDSWKTILSNSEGNHLKFLNNFWSSRYKKLSNAKIYKDFIKRIVKPKCDMAVFLNDLKSDSELFNEIVLPVKEKWVNGQENRVFLSLKAIVDTFNIEVANPILLGLVREYKNKNISLKFLKKALNIIEKYHFINNAISSNRSSGLDTMYASISRELSNAVDKNAKHSVIREMAAKLEDRMPSIDEFKASFDSKLYFASTETKQKKLVQYVLRKIELNKQNYNVDLNNISLEHIYPENPNSDWESLSDKDLFKNIGNLVILDSNINSKVGSKDYTAKKTIILKESTLISTKEVFDENSLWTGSEIKKRRDLIVALMYKDIWDD